MNPFVDRTIHRVMHWLQQNSITLLRVSLGLIFFLMTIPGFLIGIGAINYAGAKGLAAGGIFLAAYVLALSVVSSAVQGIFNTALYRYACDQTAPPGFSQSLFRDAWSPRS